MNIVDIVIFSIIGLAALIGFFKGFDSQVKGFGTGLFGLVIVVALVFLVSGFLFSQEFVIGMFASLQDFFIENVPFLGNGIIFFFLKYVILFVVISILVRVVFNLLGSLLGGMDKMKGINRILGAVFGGAVALCVVMLLFVVIYMLPDNGSIVAEIDSALCSGLYYFNPFISLFGVG